MKYYLVTVDKAHIGTDNSMDITFAIIAKDAYSALKRALKMPGVRHNSLFFCVTKEISKQEYNNFRKKSAYERYARQK